jgi:hypothetical protein
MSIITRFLPKFELSNVVKICSAVLALFGVDRQMGMMKQISTVLQLFMVNGPRSIAVLGHTFFNLSALL